MIPLPLYVKLSKLDCPHFDEKKENINNPPYSSTCDSLMYTMIATRPNITFTVKWLVDTCQILTRNIGRQCKVLQDT